MTEPETHFNPEAATPAWRRRLKASEPGRIAAALYRRRRLPAQLLRAPGPRRAVPIAPPTQRRRVRAVCWIAAGPGAYDRLLDTWSSAQASSPGELALLVTDDWTPDCHAAAILAVVPDAVVVRTRVPSGGPPRLWPLTALALRTALEHFDFDYLVKLDDDALVVGPGLVEAIDRAIAAASGGPGAGADASATAASAIQAARPVGIAGSFRERPDGQPELDGEYHRRILAGELPRDATLRDWAERARAGGWPEGSNVQGGALVLTRAYVEALREEGALRYVPRLPSIVSEDLLLTILAYAVGFRACSLGGPAGPYAFANKHLPLPLDELVDPHSRWLVTHSTRIGLAGEPEREIRARARAARERW